MPKKEKKIMSFLFWTDFHIDAFCLYFIFYLFINNFFLCVIFHIMSHLCHSSLYNGTLMDEWKSPAFDMFLLTWVWCEKIIAFVSLYKRNKLYLIDILLNPIFSFWILLLKFLLDFMLVFTYYIWVDRICIF